MEPMDVSQHRIRNLPEIEVPGNSPADSPDPASGAVRTGIWSRVRSSANHPNGLTVIRIAMIPLIILLFSFPSSRFMVFIAALPPMKNALRGGRPRLNGFRCRPLYPSTNLFNRTRSFLTFCRAAGMKTGPASFSQPCNATSCCTVTHVPSGTGS